MMKSKSALRWALAGAGAMIFSLGATTAMAGSPTVTGCQAALQKIVGKYGAAVSKNLSACANTVQKSLDKGLVLSGTAEGAACNGKIIKIQGALAKAQAGCVAAKCDANTLHLLGHMVGGDNAPGASALGFVCNYLLERAEELAIQGLYANNPDAGSQIAGAAAAPPAAGNTALIAFAATEPDEATHACTLSGTATASLATAPPILFGTLTFPVTGKVLVNVNPDVAGGAFVYLSGGVGKGISPVTSLPFGTVCVETVGAEGACDCGAALHWNKNITLCRDSDTSGGGAGDQCLPGPTISLNNSPGTAPAPINNGPLWATFGPNLTGAGDCTGALTTQFTIVTSGQVGVDGVACTPDDIAVPLPSAPIPFTTGTASSEIFDVNNNDGNVLGPLATAGAAAASCTALDTSNFSGLKLVGAVPTMDGTQTGDAIIEVNLSCS